MNPKDKAVELIEKFKPLSHPYTQSSYTTDITSEEVVLINAKKCALITVKELLDDDMSSMDEIDFDTRIMYWVEVEEHINNLNNL